MGVFHQKKGKHIGLPLPNTSYSGAVGANLRVRPQNPLQSGYFMHVPKSFIIRVEANVFSLKKR
jgi:hypothetical protein